ncbi:hypothetical protein E8E13_004855 [Curvularia kusanoi]|uniref:Uncharacterized protein n=1 Tax=Curvularia kusanoi TaxID=90978 RepID=A0A9P4W776_CURKU|nr:hypothetical protein E8E13_004855 [Curvularia kusanoi]
MMRSNNLWTIVTLAPAALAQGLRQATGGVEPTSIVQWYPTPTPEVSNCTANLITKLCDYKEPGSAFAVASTGKAMCWEYCNAHQPCNFVIFVAGNPYTGSGNCWLYPGEQFDKSAGEEGCEALSVYDKPTCAEPTPTAGACIATASPSAVASICDYPTPDDNCWSSCTASTGATNCLSQCAESESCSYAVFNPGNEDLSPYAAGTCWMYPNGTYDATKAGSCSGKPEQFVYENPCPKPASTPAASGSASGSVSGAKTSATGTNVDAERVSGGVATPTVKPNSATIVRGFGSASFIVIVGFTALMW